MIEIHFLHVQLQMIEIVIKILLDIIEVIVQIRIGALPPISKHREELKLRGEAELLWRTSKSFEIGTSPTYKYLNVLLNTIPYFPRKSW